MLEMLFATIVAKRCCALRTQTQTNKDLLSQVLICLVGAGGFEPPKAVPTDLQSAPFGHSGTLPYLILQKNGAGGRT